MTKRTKVIFAVLALIFCGGVLFTLTSVTQTADAATVVKQGSKGEIVRQIQTKLKNWGYYTGSVDGVFGAKTTTAVKSFQKKNGLTQDGVVKHKDFPNSISGVIYQPWAFTAVNDGQINMGTNDECIKACQDAMNGWDPTYGCIYYYNPATATNKWIRSRPITVTIGKHVFCK